MLFSVPNAPKVLAKLEVFLPVLPANTQSDKGTNGNPSTHFYYLFCDKETKNSDLECEKNHPLCL